MDRSAFTNKYGPDGIYLTPLGGDRYDVIKSGVGVIGTADGVDDAASKADKWLVANSSPSPIVHDPPDVQS